MALAVMCESAMDDVAAMLVPKVVFARGLAGAETLTDRCCAGGAAGSQPQACRQRSFGFGRRSVEGA